MEVRHGTCLMASPDASCIRLLARRRGHWAGSHHRRPAPRPLEPRRPSSLRRFVLTDRRLFPPSPRQRRSVHWCGAGIQCVCLHEPRRYLACAVCPDSQAPIIPPPHARGEVCTVWCWDSGCLSRRCRGIGIRLRTSAWRVAAPARVATPRIAVLASIVLTNPSFRGQVTVSPRPASRPRHMCNLSPWRAPRCSPVAPLSQGSRSKLV